MYSCSFQLVFGHWFDFKFNKYILQACLMTVSNTHKKWAQPSKRAPNNEIKHSRTLIKSKKPFNGFQNQCGNIIKKNDSIFVILFKQFLQCDSQLFVATCEMPLISF